MTDIILTFVPFLAAVAFFIRARGEQKLRHSAEQRSAELERRIGRDELYQREWLAKLAHELRTPVAAILGYSELLEDGMFGTLDARGLDALARIRAIADQMVHLAEGLERAAEPDADTGDDAMSLPATTLVNEAVAALRVDADAREVRIDVAHSDVQLHTRPDDARRALELALGAAIKSSPGHTIHITAEERNGPAIHITHTRLDPLHDDPVRVRENTPDGERPRLTGPALRIEMARRIVESSLRGRLQLTATPEGCTARLELPRLD